MCSMPIVQQWSPGDHGRYHTPQSNGEGILTETIITLLKPKETVPLRRYNV